MNMTKKYLLVLLAAIGVMAGAFIAWAVDIGSPDLLGVTGGTVIFENTPNVNGSNVLVSGGTGDGSGFSDVDAVTLGALGATNFLQKDGSVAATAPINFGGFPPTNFGTTYIFVNTSTGQSSTTNATVKMEIERHDTRNEYNTNTSIAVLELAGRYRCFLQLASDAPGAGEQKTIVLLTNGAVGAEKTELADGFGGPEAWSLDVTYQLPTNTTVRWQFLNSSGFHVFGDDTDNWMMIKWEGTR